MAAAQLCWVREMPGVYTSRGRHDDRWRIVQATSDRWSVYRDGADFDLGAISLAEAKMAAEEEDDPAARARRDGGGSSALGASPTRSDIFIAGEESGDD
jgi:hypothetical protein